MFRSNDVLLYKVDVGGLILNGRMPAGWRVGGGGSRRRGGGVAILVVCSDTFFFSWSLML